MEAIANDVERTMVINTPHNGALKGFPPEAVFELPCLVSGSGIQPLSIADLPRPVWGLVAAVKNYEQLAVDAAVSGSRDTALLALLAHPLVGDYDLARVILDEMLDAHRAYLPQFFRN
jgi:6-phospho-beta-glucosidase